MQSTKTKTNQSKNIKNYLCPRGLKLDIGYGINIELNHYSFFTEKCMEV